MESGLELIIIVLRQNLSPQRKFQFGVFLWLYQMSITHHLAKILRCLKMCAIDSFMMLAACTIKHMPELRNLAHCQSSLAGTECQFPKMWIVYSVSESLQTYEFSIQRFSNILLWKQVHQSFCKRHVLSKFLVAHH